MITLVTFDDMQSVSKTFASMVGIARDQGSKISAEDPALSLLSAVLSIATWDIASKK
jgi:hypothetical protein